MKFPKSQSTLIAEKKLSVWPDLMAGAPAATLGHAARIAPENAATERWKGSGS